MDNKPSFYRRAIDTFELPPERAEKIAAQMVALGVDRDDEYLLLFLATGRIEHLVEALPASIQGEGKALIAGMASAVSDTLDKKLETLPVGLAEKLDARMDGFVASLVQNIDLAVTKEAARRQNGRQAVLVFTAALTVLVGVGVGYLVGRDTVAADAARWSSVVNLEDGGKWLNLARWNDYDKMMAQGCGPNDGVVISGRKVCSVPVATGPAVATSKGVDFVRLSLSEYAVKLGWWGYGIIGVGGLLVGRFFGRRRSA